MRAILIYDLLSTFYYHQIRQIIEIELEKWKKRAEEQHSIRLSWSEKGELDTASA
jgi:hypothetical protein